MFCVSRRCLGGRRECGEGGGVGGWGEGMVTCMHGQTAGLSYVCCDFCLSAYFFYDFDTIYFLFHSTSFTQHVITRVYSLLLMVCYFNLI